MSSINFLFIQLTILAALYTATALRLLRFALICVALFPPVCQNRQLDEYIFYGRRTLEITTIVLLYASNFNETDRVESTNFFLPYIMEVFNTTMEI
jgi:hypothetical protein